MKKVVPALIINALIINFSLFATRVVVDVSNIVARVFYNSMKVRDTDGKDLTIAGYKSVSEVFVAAFNPQKIFQPTLLTEKGFEGSTADGIEEGEQKSDIRNTNRYATIFIIISLIASMILLSVAVMFWKTAFFFLGRTIGIYIAMIFSPFAFLTRGNIPLLGKVKTLSWDSWVKDLGSYALLAPIFAFFLYIIFLFAQSNFVKVFLGDLDGSFAEVVVSIAVPMLIIYFLIKQGVEIAKTYAGFIGGMIQAKVDGVTGGFGGVVGGGIGLAAGGAAFLGRNAIARPVSAIAKKTGVEKWAAANQTNSKFARGLNSFLSASKTGSWDARNASAKIFGKQYSLGTTVNKGFATFGEKVTDNISKKVNLGQDKAISKKEGEAGGIVKLDKARAKKVAGEIKEELNFSHLSDDEAKSVWKSYIERHANKDGAAAGEEAFATGKSSEYKNLADTIKEDEAKLDAKRKEFNDLHDKIRASSSRTEQEALRKEAAAKSAEIKEGQNNISMLKNTKSQELEKLKKDNADYKESKEYKDAIQAEKDKFDKYGNVKDAKLLASAMRAEYAEKLRQNSTWMKDGKQRIPWWGQPGASTAGGLSALLPFISLAQGAIGGALSNYLQSEGEVMDQALKNIIKEHKDGSGKGSKLGKLTKKVDDFESKIKDALKTHYGKTIDESLDELSDDYIDTGLIGRKMKYDEEITETKSKIDAETDPEKKKALEIDRKLLEKRKIGLDKIREEHEKAKNELDKHKAEIKKREEDKEKSEGKEKPEGGGDKKKES